MATTHQQLKQRQRNERQHHPESIGLRIHRALSWLNRAEQSDDDDGRFIFLWIAFNAAYANELGNNNISEGQQFNHFLQRLIELDKHQRLHHIIWQQYTGSIRILLDNPYVYPPFWHHHNGQPGFDNWQEQFNREKQAAHKALAANDTSKVLGIIFSRLYTLRNQLVHGGATWNSTTNRDQLRDANRILGSIVPVVIEILLDNTQAHWGDACYPVVQ